MNKPLLREVGARRHVAFAAFTLALGLPLGAAAQSLPIGKALYASNCLACHGTPPRYVDNAARGANNPSLIRSAINAGLGGMRALSFLSNQDLTDIATYMGNYASVPASASTSTERVLNWAEWKYQSVLLPRASSQNVSSYVARYYTTPGFYVGTDGSSMFLYSAGTGLQNLGSLSGFVSQAAADGF
ncbi:MAG TPA: cytochrome c [Burkholderiaceae bacterium]|jgi:mono/diheme cytochrome c family protein|nr:cytochrome c [Burkholderiaceae bacterium]